MGVVEPSTIVKNERPSEEIGNKPQNNLIASIVDEPVLSDEDKIFFELEFLIETIEESKLTEVCYFFDQLEVIRDRFKIVDKSKIAQYFEKLVNVVQEDENEGIRKQ